MSNAVSSELKETIRQSFKKACLLRLEGKETEAVKILQEQLPPYIKQWQEQGSVSAQEIEDFFAAELARTENANWIINKVQTRLTPQLEAMQTNAQAEAMQQLLNAQMKMGFEALSEKLKKIMGEVVTYQGAEAMSSRVAQELSTRVKNAVSSSMQQIQETVAGFATNEVLTDQVALLKDSLGAEIRKLVGVVATPESLARVVQEQIAAHDARVSGLIAKIDDLKETTGEAIAQRTQEIVGEQISAQSQKVSSLIEKVNSLQESTGEAIAQRTHDGIAEEIKAMETRQASQIAQTQTALAVAMESFAKRGDIDDLKSAMADVVREQIIAHDARVNGLSEKLDEIRETAGQAGQAIAQRAQAGVTDQLRELEQRQAAAVKDVQAKSQEVLMAALDTLAKKSDLQDLLNGDHLTMAVDQIKANLTQMVSEQMDALSAGQAQLSAAVDQIKNSISESVREQLIAHDARVNGLSEKLDEIRQSADEKIDSLQKTTGESSQSIAQSAKAGVSSEIKALEERQAAKAKESQDAFSSALAKLLKREELESVIAQSQTLLIQNLESQKKSLNEMVTSRMGRVDGMFTDLKVALIKRLEGMVSAETFEGRLMATANMMADAQSKALAETSDALATLIDKRLAESTGPIYQRMSSVLTVSDWERMTRELNEKFLGRIEASVTTQIDEKVSAAANSITQNSKTTLEQLGALRAALSGDMASVKSALDESSKTIAERLAALYIENAQTQTEQLDALKAALTEKQTQSLGLMNASQQNFIESVRKENAQVTEAIKALMARQETIEQTQAQIASTLKSFDAKLISMSEAFLQMQTTLPQALQGIQKSVEVKLTDQTAKNQAEMVKLVAQVQSGVTENVAKRLENIRLVVK